MKYEKKIIMTMVLVKLSWLTPTPMHRQPPMARQSHSQKMRPRMPRYLANTSEMMPPVGREMMLIRLRCGE